MKMHEHDELAENSEIKRKSRNYSLPIGEVSGFDPSILMWESMKAYHYTDWLFDFWNNLLICCLLQ